MPRIESFSAVATQPASQKSGRFVKAKKSELSIEYKVGVLALTVLGLASLVFLSVCETDGQAACHLKNRAQIISSLNDIHSLFR